MSPKTEETTAKGADDPKAKKDGEKKDAKAEKEAAEKAEEELSEEDKKLKDELELCVERLQESDASLYSGALSSMRTLIRASTTSMTSVPKPLKFMIPHYDAMKEIFEKIQDNKVKKQCADVVSGKLKRRE